MADAARYDAWRAGDGYDAYMGRWSRKVAPAFLDWLGASPGGHWLDVGCGTGALSEAILARRGPASLIGVDPSEDFVATAAARITDGRAAFRLGDARALAFADASRDVVVSGLALNFVPEPERGLTEMRRVARRGGLVGFYVWDYPGEGLAFVRAFWRAAAALDPQAAALTENARFAFCTREGLGGMARTAGLEDVRATPLEIETTFRDFADYWRPFTLGGGPAPGYCAALPDGARARLRERLENDLPRDAAGAISMKARAWGVQGRAP